MIWRGRDESTDETPEEQGSTDPRPDGSPSSVGNRIESVLDAAERAALGIREDAQEWARRYLEESRRKADEAASQRIHEISSLTDNLVARARAVAQQSDELIAALDDAGRRVLNNSKPDPPSSTPPAAPPPAEVAPVPPTQSERPPSARPPSSAPSAPEPSVPEPPPLREAPPPPAPSPAVAATPPPAQPGGEEAPRVSEGARLLATQMAVAGSTRDEIAWRLREEFGIEDATAILDEIGI